MPLSRTFLTSVVWLFAVTPTAVAGQNAGAPAPTPAPAPAPTGVQGPPDGLIVPPAPGQRPVPRFTPLPAPAPAPSPAPTPAPSPTTAAPRQQQPATRAGPAPAPTPVIDPAPFTPVPPPALPDLPNVPATDVPPTAGTPLLPPPSSPLSPSAPVPADPASTLPEWLPLAAIGGGIALIGAALLWWRRRNRPPAPLAPDLPAAAVSPPAEPRPLAAKTPLLAPAPAPASPSALGRRADVAIAFEPLSAQSTLINLRMRYAITVTNNGSIDATDVAVRIGLFAGSGVNPQGISQWFMLDGETPHHGVVALAPDGTHRFEGELAAPLDALNPMTVDGRRLAIPLVAIDARYGHAPGEAPIEGQCARSFVIGREPASRDGGRPAKLAPFRIDQGPASFAPLGLRDTGIGRVA